jgi:hypothetical protein
MITPSRSCASSIARADLPLAVGPQMMCMVARSVVMGRIAPFYDAACKILFNVLF